MCLFLQKENVVMKNVFIFTEEGKFVYEECVRMKGK